LDPASLCTQEEGEQWQLDDYRAMLANGGPVFGRIYKAIAEPSCGPVVFHCAGGKDRTGMTAALRLSALGVDRQTVLDDYQLTTPSHGPERTAQVADIFVAGGIAEPVAQGILSTPRWAMAEALDILDTTYGGIDPYLFGPAGLATNHLRHLRGRLLE
jgi:protein-tyrosine phosphatase